ncbi:HNH endonuclease family protein [Corynebacterium nuruki]|uniref:HNH endonuclease family protein n=1 Tax=Corynebacterium nuruki TaxID=1032851 RepID=UPI0039BF868F
MGMPRPATTATTVTARLPAAGCLLVALVIVATVVAVARTGGPTSPDDADRRTVAALLDRVTVVDRRVRVLGYDRDQFGGWTSGVTADGGYCTSREAVLVTTFGRRRGSAGPPACPDPGPTAVDVYTGRRISPGEVEIDHVVPLAAAWDHGAHAWPRDRRVAFANDLALNLVAVAGPVNQAKSDGTPGEWLPPGDGAVPCAYVARYLTVSVGYGLTVSDADAAASRRSCRL